MKRMTSKAVFQKRWFEFDPNTNMISYYREQPLGDADNVQPVGTILVKTIEKVVSGSDPKQEEATPSEHIIHIHCVGRVYTLCAPNEHILTSWIKGVTAASDEEKRKKRRKRELQEKVLFSRARPSLRKWRLRCHSHAPPTQAGVTVEEDRDASRIVHLISHQNGSVQNQSKAVDKYVIRLIRSAL